ncbi:hypothetical protein BU17DRAFT_29458, partial [Hysterangium stoloniferum]
NALKCPQCGTHYSIKSDNPFLLHMLDWVDGLTSRAGTYISLGIVTDVCLVCRMCVTFLFCCWCCLTWGWAAIYAFCMYYGAHTVHVFVGEHMYGVIIGHDPREWSWWTYWNLPLVALYLVTSRL